MKLFQIIPKLPYIDREATLRFYTGPLRFQLLADYPDYLILQQSGQELHFFAYPDLLPERSDFMIYLRIQEDIEDFYQDLQQAGLPIHPNGPLQDQPWKQREFSLIDPAGTLLTFGQAIV